MKNKRECEHCGHKPGKDLVLHNGILYPRYIRLGKNGTRMRFQKSRYGDEMVYYRHGGNWEMGVSHKMFLFWRRFYSHIPTHPYIDGVRIYPTTYIDWKRDNGDYV